MSRLKNQKGFTLVELIVVIAILGIMALIAIPLFSGFNEQAKIAADQANVRILNSVTPLARLNIAAEDPFIDENKIDEDLIKFLLDGGYLASEVEAQSKDAEFAWETNDERWYLLSLSQGGIFLSLDDLKDEYLHGSGFYTGVLGFRPGAHTRFQGLATDIFIPKEINGQEIFGIYNDFFRYGSDDRPGDKLTSVSFDPNSVIKTIHARAFYNNNLSHIDFPETVESIDLWAFRDNKLSEVKLPPNLHTIEQRAFYGNSLEKIKIGSNVTIGDRAFGENTDLFIQAYDNGGPGSYVWDGESWIKQED